MLQQVKALQFYSDLSLLSRVLSPTENSRIQGLSRLLSYTQKNNWRILKFFWLYNIWEYNFQTNYFVIDRIITMQFTKMKYWNSRVIGYDTVLHQMYRPSLPKVHKQKI